MGRSKGCVGVVAGVIAALGIFSTSAKAALLTGYSTDGDSGTLRITTFSPTTSFAQATFNGLYGSPVITTIASGWKLTFTPSSAFFAGANNGGGGEAEQLAGKLDFTVTFDSQINLTVNIFESGIFSKVGDGTVQVFGGGSVTEKQDAVPAETIPPNGNLTATYNNTTNGWSAYDQIGGFTGSYNKYSVSIDNDLIAQALADSSSGSAMIAKKTFVIYLTTDGSSGGTPPVPEPASLGVLALGGLALLSRRRRV